MEETKQRLWIVSELFPPDETSTSYILGEIANAMVKKYKVEVICGPEIYDNRKIIDIDNCFRIHESIVVHRVRCGKFDKNTTMGKTLSLLSISYKIMSLVRKSVCKNDKVLIVTNPALIVPLMVRHKCKVGFELNVLVHDVFPENTKPAGFRLPFYGLIKGIFDKSYAKADQLIVLGRDMAQVLYKKIKNGLSDNGIIPKITIIENWADIDNIKPQKMPNGKIVLEYAGNIGRVQGLAQVIEQLPELVEMHIYGTGSMENKLKEMKNPRVFFHGPYFRSQQNDILANCHIAIVTLQQGMYGLGVPSKTYNILAAGRPVLFFGPKDSEIDLLIREKSIGYCGWPEQFDIMELEQMGKRARLVAETEYSKNIIINKILKAL